MRRKSIAFLMAIVMLVTTFAFQFSAFAADSSISVQFQNGNTSATGNTIAATYNLTNKDSAPLNLADVKLRYYFTKDSDTAINFWCDHSGYMRGYDYIDVTSKVKGTFVSMPTATATADTYLEVSFASDAGSLPAGGSITIQTRAARTDWSNFNQSNDYSYKASGSLIDWDHITAYISGSLKYGVEPIPGQGNQDPSIAPTSATFDKGAPADVAVTINENGNTFKGIDGLVKDTDYTVSGTTVKILSKKLATYATGSTQKFTFDFGVSVKPVLTVSIVDSSTSTDSLKVSLGKATGATGETVVIPVTMKDVAKAGKVGTFGFNVNFDSKLLEAVKVEAGSTIKNAAVNFSSQINAGSISFLFLDNTIGSELIEEDGVVANITFKVLGTTAVETPVTFKDGAVFGDASMAKIAKVTLASGSVTVIPVIPEENELSVSIGKGSAETGETVVIPVTMKDVAKAGKVGTFGFNVLYDSNVLEAVKVEAGSIVKNAAVNFSSQKNAGSISFLFLDNTIGDELIEEDGVVANITFKVLGTTAVETPVTFKDGSVFGDAAMAKIAKVSLANGSVTVVPGQVVVTDPEITPATASFVEGSASDIAVTLTANGNTFVGITGLTKGSDYTLAGDVVTISKNYLNKLAAGTKALTFDFGSAKNPVLTITVKDKPIVEIKGLGVTVGTAAAKTGETVTIPVTLKNVSKVGKVGTFGFTVNYDANLLEATKVEAGSIVISPAVNFSSQIKAGTVTFLFLDNTIGDQLISEDGVVANITFKVLGSSGTAELAIKDGAVFGDANMSKIADVTLTNGSVKLN